MAPDTTAISREFRKEGQSFRRPPRNRRSILSKRERQFLSLLRGLHAETCTHTYTHTPAGEEPMIAGNCFSAVAYLSLRFAQRPQRYAPTSIVFVIETYPVYKTRTKFNFFHRPKYIRFVSPRSFSLLPPRPPILCPTTPSSLPPSFVY